LQPKFAVFALIGLLAQLVHAQVQVLAVDVDGIVHPITVEILSRAIDQAKQNNHSLVLLRLNTPGGLMDAMRECVSKIVASPVPVVTYVSPSGGRAASAGFFLLEAGDVAAMAPATNTGAAHPLVISTQVDPVLLRKLENDAAASLRSIVSKRGRNSALAEKAVLESRSFTDKEALDQKLIDLIARNDQDLLRQLDDREITHFDGNKQILHLKNANIVTYEKSIRQKFLSAISDPNVALVLLVLGALGIYVEFSTPGLIVPGVAGAILALLGLSAIAVLPINRVGASLLLLALTLFVLEAKITSHGVLGSGGAICMVLGAVLLVDSPLPELRIHLSTAVALALPFAVITMFLVSLVVRARRSKVATGTEAMIGETGVVISEVAPEGNVFIHGEYWTAVSPAPVSAGSQVKVMAINGLRLTVKPI
jgi:membrane-bound serine protease (ClpP class)